jgi:hypothetical protein
MRRVVLALALAAGIVIGLSVPISGLGLISVTLTCDDGTSVTSTVDTDTLNSLTDSVNAMTLYPAGLSCTLVQNPLTTFFGHVAVASSGDTFIVGGGRWQVPCSAIFPGGVPGGALPRGVVARVPPGAWAYPPGDPSFGVSTTPDVFIWVNIAVNAHLSDTTNPNSAFGSLNETIPANQSPCGTLQVGESHFTSKPTCLTVDNTALPPIAFVTSQVTKASDGSGQVPFPVPSGTGSVAVNEFVHFGFQDFAVPPGQATATTSDMLNGPPAAPEGTQTANCTTESPPTFHLGINDPSVPFKQYGNLTLHQ